MKFFSDVFNVFKSSLRFNEKQNTTTSDQLRSCARKQSKENRLLRFIAKLNFRFLRKHARFTNNLCYNY